MVTDSLLKEEFGVTVSKLDSATLSQMILAGAQHLTNNAKMIDSLNVFPVPDGDTGTNMNLSMTSGVKEVRNNTSDRADDLTHAFAKGLLMGARGNSGVILSQLFRGFAKGVEGNSTLSVEVFAKGLDAGVKTAYKAVMKPVEGTILTVAKDSAKKAMELAEKEEEDMIVFLEKVIKEAKSSLKRTPDLLPVLKEVGVVDSGGQGLVIIYEGLLASLKGEELPVASEDIDLHDMVNAEHHKLAQNFMDTAEIEFGYCTEFMIKLEDEKLEENPYDEEAFRNELSQHGDSLLVVSDEEVVKVHVHVEYPGTAMTIGQRYGSLINMKIENMREQHTAIVGKKEKRAASDKAEYGIITVAAGDGLKKLFESLGTSVVIQGGQTMNPSTQDIANAIEEAHAKNLIILPNNKNIIMAAEQAAELSEDNVVVVPTKTIPQGMSAMLAFQPDAELEKNKTNMTEASKLVKSGQVTYAVRDTQIDGMTIEKGNFMGLAEGKIKSTDKDKLEAAKQLLNQMVTEEDELITILQGEDAKDKEIEELEAFIAEHFEEAEVEVHQGNQPIYSFIFSVE